MAAYLPQINMEGALLGNTVVYLSAAYHYACDRDGSVSMDLDFHWIRDPNAILI